MKSITVVALYGPVFMADAREEYASLQDTRSNVLAVRPDFARDLRMGAWYSKPPNERGLAPSMDTTVWQIKEIFRRVKTLPSGGTLVLYSDHELGQKKEALSFVAVLLACIMCRTWFMWEERKLRYGTDDENFEYYMSELKKPGYWTELPRYFWNHPRFAEFTVGERRALKVAETELRRKYKKN